MDIDKINKIDWIKSKERDIDIAIQSIYIFGHKKIFFKANGFDFEVKNHLALSSGKLFFDSKDLVKAKLLTPDKKNDLYKNLKKATVNFLKLANDYNKFLEEHKNYNYENISRSELVAIYKDYINHNYNLIPYSFIVSMIMEEIARDQLAKYFTNISQVIVPQKLNRITEEHFSRLELSIEYKKNKNSKNFKKLLDKHLQLYSWISYYRPTDEPLTEKDLLKDISLYNNPEEERVLIKKRRKKFLKEAKNIINTVKPPAQIINLVQLMQENAWVRTYRRELMSQGFMIMRSMYMAIAKYFNVNFKDLQYIASWEIEDYLKNNKKINKEYITQRKKLFALIKLGDTIDTINGSDINNIIIKDKYEQIQELKGQKCYKGNVIGIIQQIKTKNELTEFKEGNILLAPTVATWMTPIVKKCSGIITESGGLLSHTAIVAREFAKPCIINVKSATDILDNGQKVLLDADNSIIKIIS